MTTLIALFVAGSFVYDGVRDRLVATANSLSPPTRRVARSQRYALFAMRRLPEWQDPESPSPSSSSPGGSPSNPQVAAALDNSVRRIAQLVTQALPPGSVSQETQDRTQRAIEERVRQAGLVTVALSRHAALKLARAQDSLPFPAPSLRRRLVAWTVDSLVVSMVSSLFRFTGFKGSIAAVLWLGRDLWLAPLNLPSPGRWLAGQVVVTTGLARHVNSEFAPVRDPGLVGENPQLAAYLHHQQQAVVAHLGAAQLYDADTFALISHNALRLLLRSLGPLAGLLWLGTTVGTYMSAPRGLWDGRTLWDRWSGVQVVDEEVLLGWATTGIVLAGNEGRSRRQRGVASNGVRTQPSGFTDYGMTSATAAGAIDTDDDSADDGAFPAHLLNSSLDPSSTAAAVAEMYVPPVQYMGTASTSSSYPDPDDFDPISPPPMAPVRDSFFGGAYGAALSASAGVSPTGPEPMYYPFPPTSGAATPSTQAGLIHSALDGLEQALRSAPVAAADGGPDGAEASFNG